MKRKRIDLMLAGLLLLLAGCMREETLGPGKEEEGVRLNLSVSLPEMPTLQTRVLDDETLNPLNPDAGYLQSLKLYMFIFENTGSVEGNYLRTLVHGDQIKVESTGDEPDHAGQLLQTYTATVDGTSEDAVIHLVATADPDFEDQLRNSTDRSELGLFSGATGLYTSGNYPAFWKRIDLGMPISKETKEDVEAQLKHVQMIRNFVRVTVRLNEDHSNLNGFQLMGYALVNAVDHGYVAAYSENEPRGFVEFEKSSDEGSLTGEMLSYEHLLNDAKYVGSRHPLSERKHAEERLGEWLDADEALIFSDAPKYMFERPYQDQHRTFVVVKGHFGDASKPRYIKLDIGTAPGWFLNENGEAYGVFETYNLLRNFSYDITIDKVASPSVGNASPEGAVAAPPANNVGTSVETKSLQDIADGYDRMWVNMTKLIIVDDDNGNPYPSSVDLMWRYVKDYKASGWQNVSDGVKYDYPGMSLVANDEIGIFASVSGSTAKGKPEGFTEGNTDYGNFYGSTLTFNKPDETVRQKTVRLYYPDQNSGSINVNLSRDITFVMRKRWEFVTNDKYKGNVEVYPGAYSYENGTMPYESLDEMRENIEPGYVGSQAGAQLTVMFELPEDLPQSIFPLDFTIGADRQNIENAYLGNATAISGPSIFDDQDGATRIQFVKTVTWDYYNGSGDYGSNGHRIVCARFITTTDVLYESSVEEVAVTRIRVTNPYFTLGEDDFKRHAHEDVVDPTRTRWYWNFSYPEWATYFTTYPDNAGYDPHNLNNLTFADYEKGSNSKGGNFMSIATGDADNPAFSFPLDFHAESGYIGKITIKGSPSKNGHRDGATLGVGGNWTHYNRYVYIRVTTNKQTIDIGPMSFEDDGSNERLNTASDGYTAEIVVSTETLTFNIDRDEVLQEISIWSTIGRHTGNAPGSRREAYLKEAPTNYYSILFELTPQN